MLIVGHHPCGLQSTMPRPPLAELYFTADDIAATLDPEHWDIITSAAVPQAATDPDGHGVTTHDTVLRARHST